MPKDKRVYLVEDLKMFEITDLKNNGYYFYSGRNIYGEKTNYLFKPFFRESARHGILVYEVAKYLREYTKNVREYLSRNPDIIFDINGVKWAVEIETGKVLLHNKKQFYEKVARLRSDWGRNWFFVITNRNRLKTYSRYGKTFTRRNVIKKIKKLYFEEYGEIY